MSLSDLTKFLDPDDLARKLYDCWMQLLRTDKVIGPAFPGNFSLLLPDAREALAEAADMTICSPIEKAYESLKETENQSLFFDSPFPPASDFFTKDGPQGVIQSIICYFCGRHPAIQHLACSKCLENAKRDSERE